MTKRETLVPDRAKELLHRLLFRGFDSLFALVLLVSNRFFPRRILQLKTCFRPEFSAENKTLQSCCCLSFPVRRWKRAMDSSLLKIEILARLMRIKIEGSLLFSSVRSTVKIFSIVFRSNFLVSSADFLSFDETKS